MHARAAAAWQSFCWRACLFAGLFIHIGMLAGISGETKRVDALSRELVALSAQRDNLEVSLSMLKNPERIAQLAAQMGMERPTQDAIRVVSLPIAQDDAQTRRPPGCPVGKGWSSKRQGGEGCGWF